MSKLAKFAEARAEQRSKKVPKLVHPESEAKRLVASGFVATPSLLRRIVATIADKNEVGELRSALQWYGYMALVATIGDQPKAVNRERLYRFLDEAVHKEKRQGRNHLALPPNWTWKAHLEQWEVFLDPECPLSREEKMAEVKRCFDECPEESRPLLLVYAKVFPGYFGETLDKHYPRLKENQGGGA